MRRKTQGGAFEKKSLKADRTMMGFIKKKKGNVKGPDCARRESKDKMPTMTEYADYQCAMQSSDIIVMLIKSLQQRQRQKSVSILVRDLMSTVDSYEQVKQSDDSLFILYLWVYSKWHRLCQRVWIMKT